MITKNDEYLSKLTESNLKFKADTIVGVKNYKIVSGKNIYDDGYSLAILKRFETIEHKKFDRKEDLAKYQEEKVKELSK